jgi:hypothetical protein
MTRPNTALLLSALLLLASALVGGWAGWQHSHSAAPAPDTLAQPGPVIPPNIRPVQIDFPPETDTPPGGDPLTAELSQIWETNAQQAPATLPQALTQPSWYITGVVQQGDNTRVMVQFQGEPTVRFFKVGDTLPGGSRLAWVQPGAIGVVTPKRKSIQVPILQSGAPPAPPQGKATPAEHLAKPQTPTPKP